jgi:hypothetical protein
MKGARGATRFFGGKGGTAMTDTALVWNGKRAQPRKQVLYSDGPRVERENADPATPLRVSQRVPVRGDARRALRFAWMTTESGLRCQWSLSDE